MAELPKSLLTPAHLQYLKEAEKVLDNLQFHIDQARRVDLPNIEEHQKTKDKHKESIRKFMEVYFHGQ